MSELKVIKIELNNHGKPIASIQGTTSYYGISPNGMFYPQEEADKYIALLKDKANYNECAYKLKSQELADTCRFYEDEIRHQKRKRCLAMAVICFNRAERANCWKEEVKSRKRFEKWMEIADKFKEAK